MTLVIRSMRWWDINEVFVLEQQLFPHDPWTAGQFWSELARVPESRDYVVADIDGAIRGYAGLFAVAPDADVQTIAVDPSAQGRGIGQQLLTHLLEAAAARHCSTMLLEVRSDNEVAIRLYERNGFTRISKRRDYYGSGVDAFVMSARLGEAA